MGREEVFGANEANSSMLSCFSNDLRAIVYALDLLIFLLHSLLQIEVQLSFFLQSLLFHISDYTLMHGSFLGLLCIMDEENRTDGKTRGAREGKLSCS